MFLENEKVKTFKTQLKTLRHMTVSQFRQKFRIPSAVNQYFFFCEHSEFGREVTLAEEAKQRVLGTVSNYDEYIKLRKAEKWDNEENSLRVRVFLKPYMIPPKFSTKDEYGETLLHLNMLEQYVESLKEKVFYKGTFDFDRHEQR